MDGEKKPVKRLGGLNSGPGAGRLGSLKAADGAGPSSVAGGSAAPAAAGGARKMRFMPTNFARPKQRADSTSEGGPSTASASLASKSDGAFSDLMKAAKSEAAWQRQRGGRGRGAGNGRAMTTFGGGAGDGAGGAGGAGVRRVWGGRGAGAASAAGSGPKRLVKSGERGGVKGEDGVKSEDGGAGGGEDDEGAQQWRAASEEDEEELEELEEDPINYDQYYPVMLPQREQGESMPREYDDPTRSIPKDLFDLPESYQPMLEELSFLQDVEQNDGRLMLFQLPALLPVSAQHAQQGGVAGASVAASRPAQLQDLPSSRIGKLLVFASGKVKMQIGDVLLDVDPGIPPRFRQDLAVISPQSKQCVMLAPISLRMVCTPNLDTLLDPERPLPEWPRVGAAAAAAAAGDSAGLPSAGRRAAEVGDDSSSSGGEEEEGEEGVRAMDVDGEEAAANGGGAAVAAAHGKQQQQQQQPVQQQQQQQRPAGRQRQGLPGIAVKKEEEEEEVVSPRRGGSGGGGVRSPRGGLRSPRGGAGQQKGGGDGGDNT